MTEPQRRSDQGRHTIQFGLGVPFALRESSRLAQWYGRFGSTP